MKRDLNAIKAQVAKFFTSKDSDINLGFVDEDLGTTVSITTGDKGASLHIENRFFKKEGEWNELTEKLEDYWSNQFPNKKPARIVPWPR